MLLPRRPRVGRRDEHEGGVFFPLFGLPVRRPGKGRGERFLFPGFRPFSEDPKKAGLNRVFTIFWPPPRGGGREQT